MSWDFIYLLTRRYWKRILLAIELSEVVKIVVAFIVPKSGVFIYTLVLLFTAEVYYKLAKAELSQWLVKINHNVLMWIGICTILE